MRMKRTVFLFVLLTPLLTLTAQDGDHTPNYDLLEHELGQSEAYDNLKERRIDSLRNELTATRRTDDAHHLAAQLGQEYHSFVNDSAIYYFRRTLEYAERLGDRATIALDRLMLINQYVYSSNHRDAYDQLSVFRADDLPDSIRSRYLSTFANLYEHMGNESQGGKKTEYYQQAAAYRDSLLLLDHYDPTLYLQTHCNVLIGEKKYDEATEVCRQWENDLTRYSRDYAVVAYYLAELAGYRGEKEQRKYWLVESSISDIRNSVKHQMALWSLAQILADEGDLNRSYPYVEHSWRCVLKFNARMLTSLISPVFTSINDSYNKQLQRANRRLAILAVATTLLALLLATAYLQMKRRGKLLSAARSNLAATNARLEGFNAQLELSNIQLNEANRLKEEYIGQFFSICSDYIDKLDKYRIKVNRKLKAGQQNELLKMTQSEQLREDEHKELLARFDHIFINMFPNFIEHFNELLEDDSRFTYNPDKPLPTTIRIFALIRLGIEESSRIAEFLNYPPGTIYNYRNRIKTHALCNRNEFEERVKSIGMN